MSNMIRVLIVDDLPETRENVRKLLQFEQDIEVVGQAGNGNQALDLAQSHQPDVILMDINMPGGDGISASQAIRKAVPNAQIIIMSVQSEADYLRKAMLAGARDFLMKPFSGDELTAAIRRVYAIPSAREAVAAPVDTPSTPTAVTQGPDRNGKILSIYSPKGGAGCTTIATNLAVGLAAKGYKTVLVDASFQFGDVGVLLKLKPNTTVIDLVDRLDDMEKELMHSVLTDHDSGLKVLLAPPKPEMAELVTNDYLEKIYETLRQMFDFIIIDTQTGLSDPTLISLEKSDRILLITQQSLSSLANMRRFFDLMNELGYDVATIMIIVNRASDKFGISIKDVEAALKRPVLSAVLMDPLAVTNSGDIGDPLIRTSPRKSRVVASIHQLVDKVEKVLVRDTGAEAQSNDKDGAGQQDQPFLKRFFGG
ncbi:MAG: response regulator [Chloroflexota bacterium]